MKTIALIALATALGLTWVGVAIPADVKEKAQDVKEQAKEKAETAKDKLQSAAEKTKEKLVEAKDKIKGKIPGGAKGGAGYDQVRAAQQALKDKGFDPGPVDGKIGPKTRAAISDFQKQAGLKVSGRLDAETADELGVQSQASRGQGNPPSASPATGEAAKPEAPKKTSP